jgi:hypothetical protein
MDVHKDSIDVATGDDSASEVRHYGTIGGEMAVVSRLARKLESTGNTLVFVYEAGPLRLWHLPVAEGQGPRMLGGFARHGAALQCRPRQDRSARMPEAGAPGTRGGVDAIHVPVSQKAPKGTIQAALLHVRNSP